MLGKYLDKGFYLVFFENAVKGIGVLIGPGFCCIQGVRLEDHQRTGFIFKRTGQNQVSLTGKLFETLQVGLPMKFPLGLPFRAVGTDQYEYHC